MFREWIYIVSALIIVTGLIVGIMQLLLKINKRIIKGVLISIFIIFLLLVMPLMCLFAVFRYLPEHVVERDGKKYVAYVDGFLKTYVYYYDYKNILIVGNQKRIDEYYGGGSFDPIKDSDKHKVQVTTYYDEDGNFISRDY